MRQDDNLLFNNWHWGQCLNYLYSNICYQCNNIVLIRGASDSGKTTLKQELIKLLPDNCKVFSMFAQNKNKSGLVELTKEITIGFEVPWSSDVVVDWEELQNAIFCEPLYNWVLIIDDAHKLSGEYLNSLISLYNAVEVAQSQLSLILFSDFSINEGANKPLLTEFINNKFQIIDLQPLNLEQMSEFLIEKLRLDFNNKTLKKIYNASGGLIGKIKHLAISESNINAKEKTRLKTMVKNLLENIINPSIVRVVVCSAFLLLSYVAFNFQKTNKKLDAIDNNYIISIDNQQQSIEHKKVIQQEANKKIAYTADNKSSTEQLATTDNLSKQLQALRYELNKIQRQVSDLSDSIDNLQGKTLSLSKANANNSLYAKNLQPSVEPFKKLQAIDSLNNYEKQLLKVDKNFYVLQIMSSKNEQSIRNLITQYSPACSNKIKYAAGNLKNHKERWYIAWYGVYNSRQSALKDLNSLPKGLQKLNPIVRDYATVHNLINSKNNKL